MSGWGSGDRNIIWLQTWSPRHSLLDDLNCEEDVQSWHHFVERSWISSSLIQSNTFWIHTCSSPLAAEGTCLSYVWTCRVPGSQLRACHGRWEPSRYQQTRKDSRHSHQALFPSISVWNIVNQWIPWALRFYIPLFRRRVADKHLSLVPSGWMELGDARARYSERSHVAL